MILALDVGYPDAGGAVIGAVRFQNWADEAPLSSETIRLDIAVEPYEPGMFYKRELPCLLYAIAELREPKVHTIVVDGLVDLGSKVPGLGRYLYNELPKGVAVIGVAKNHFHGGTSIDVFRGGSHRPLYVNAAGMSNRTAAKHILEMHGPSRIPTLLKLADTLSRA